MIIKTELINFSINRKSFISIDKGGSMRVKVSVEQSPNNITVQTYYVGILEATVHSARGKLMDGVLCEKLNVIS